MRVKSFIVYLCFMSLSVMTAVMVTSLPVPAVVGMAISGGILRHTRSSPLSLPSGLRGKAMRAPVALAQSIDEPPPKAISP